MVENWTCSACQALNPPRRKVCWQCGRSRHEPIEQPLESAPDRGQPTGSTDGAPPGARLPASPSRSAERSGRPRLFTWALDWARPKGATRAPGLKGRRRFQLWWVPAALILTAAVAVFWGYQADRSDFEALAAAYRQANCAEVLARSERLAGRPHLAAVGDLRGRAEPYREDCVPFQAAVEQERAGQLVEALTAYHALVAWNEWSPLVEAVRQRARALFERSDPEALAGLGTCRQVGSLLANGLVPEPARFLPPLYLACGRYFEAGKRTGEAVEMYLALLQSYPAHELAAEARAAMLENPASCDWYGQVEALLAAEGTGIALEFLWQCGQDYQARGELVQAVGVFERLWEGYPAHQRAWEAEAALARTLVALARAGSTQPLADPETVGGSGGERAEVWIRNGWPLGMRVAFSGPEGRVAWLEACDACEVGAGAGLPACPEGTPMGRFELAPGTYEVMMAPAGERARQLFVGRWELAGGAAYEYCICPALAQDP